MKHTDLLPRPSPNGTPVAKLDRVTFSTSREMDFFSQRELVTQTGHPKDEWPLVIIKELFDNALDACEEVDVAPVIEVAADACGISVRDNGPGLPAATLRGALNFTVRVSNREAYVSPCRGAQGNALKTLLPMPHVVDPEAGKLIVTAHGKRHEITCGADPISQRAAINVDVLEAKSKNPRPGPGEKKQLYPAPRSGWSGGRGPTRTATSSGRSGSSGRTCMSATTAGSGMRSAPSWRASPCSTRTPRSRWTGSVR
jgi:hypothetical protein